MSLKKIGIILFATTALLSCGTNQTPTEKIATLRCECLKSFDKEKENIKEVIDCMTEVNGRDKFRELGEEEIIKLMEEKCPEAALDQQ